MIQVAQSWIIILIISVLWGFLVEKIVRIVTKESFCLSLEFTLFLGIAFLTAYSQTVSLVKNVSGKAFVLAGLIGIAGLALGWRDIIATWKRLMSSDSFKINSMLVISLAVLFIALSATSMKTYDTSLYHAQAIRWIEEYGVVKGLGNLHHRLAYNSAYFALQALFSLRWLIGNSMRSMNGFLCWILVSWAACTWRGRRDKRFHITDLLRLLMIYYILVEKLIDISGCSSDLFVLSLVIYILVKWMEYSDETGSDIYRCLLAVLCAYAVTLKLSAAMMVVLVVAPAIYLIKNKKYKSIVLYIAMGIILVVPFLARNILISGYLLYPYPQIDIFPVDWKMNPYTCAVDAAEIKMWGRGITDVKQVLTPFSEWFPIWMSQMSKPMLAVFFINLILLPVTLVWLIRRLYLIKQGLEDKSQEYMPKDKVSNEVLMIPIVAYLNMALWFIGAPLPRYGGVYILVCLLCFMGTVGIDLWKAIWAEGRFGKISKATNVVLPILVGLMLLSGFRYAYDDHINLVKQPGMWAVESEKIPFGYYEEIYIPVNDGEDKLGYDAFPSTPYSRMLERIELYGDTVDDGFRVKDEYRDEWLSTNGKIHEKNIFLK